MVANTDVYHYFVTSCCVLFFMDILSELNFMMMMMDYPARHSFLNLATLLRKEATNCRSYFNV